MAVLLPISTDPYGIPAADQLAALTEQAIDGGRGKVFLICSDNDYSGSCAEGLTVGFTRLGWQIAGGSAARSTGKPPAIAVTHEQ
jgi:hypothetical protein